MTLCCKSHFLLTLVVAASCSACFAGAIGNAKRDAPDGYAVSFDDVAVTAVFEGSIYVAQQDRATAIRVDTSVGLNVGQVVDIEGTIQTDPATAERYVSPYAGYPQPTGSTLAIMPLALPVSALVGGSFGLQQGIPGSRGLNNIGTLVRVCGAVATFEPAALGWFKVVDANGTEAKVIVPSGTKADTDWAQVTVTGICTVEKVNDVMARVIKVRQSGDIANFESWVQSKLAGLTLDQKIGQMFQTRVTGDTFDDAMRQKIEELHVGNIVYFQYNGNLDDPARSAQLSNDLQACALAANGVPLLISMDQEGGRVTRITGGCEFPGNMGLGASRSVDMASLCGNVLGSEIRAVGGHMDLAPVLDVNNNAANPVIGVRSFGEQPGLASSLGIAYANGLHSAGVIATGKHFPGHGDTNVDSHSGLPVVTYNFNTLDTIHGKPFRDAVAAGLDCIMTAHIVVTCLDPVYPATLSPTVLTGYLRQNIGFDGVCMTDSMGMAGITSGYGPGPAAVLAIQAGNDLLSSLDPVIYEPGIAAVKSAVLGGTITESRIDQSVARILRLKRRYGLFANTYVDPAAASAIVGSAEHRASELSAARAAMTLIQNTDGILPLNLDPADKVLLVTVQDSAETTTDAATRFLSYIDDKHSNVQSISISRSPTSSQRTTVRDAAADAYVTIVGTSRAVPGTTTNQGQITLVNSLISDGRRVVVVGLREPYEFGSFTGVNAYLAAYNYKNCGFQAAADVIFGDHIPGGLLPVSVPDSYSFGWGLTY